MSDGYSECLCGVAVRLHMIGMGGVAEAGGGTRREPLFWLMLGVFFGGGMLNAVEALLVPRLKLTLGLGYAQALTVQLAYYASYLGFAQPAAALAARAGAMRATAIGTAVIAAGSIGVAGALCGRSFGAMLLALLVMSAGVTVLQIACNGIMATRPGGAANFAALQGFNSLGTVIGPLLGTGFLLGADGASAAAIPFVVFGLGFAALSTSFVRARDLLPREDAARPRAATLIALLRTPAMMRGFAAIFAYVGAEVTIGSLLPSYLMLGGRGGASAVDAGRLVSLYWLGAMIGRFAGAGLLRRRSMRSLLSIAALAAMILTLAAALPTGRAGAVALIAVGLANSIMFPTIFALSMPADARVVPAASMLLCVAVVGGAIVPVATGFVADHGSLPFALVVPLACYAAILAYACIDGGRARA